MDLVYFFLVLKGGTCVQNDFLFWILKLFLYLTRNSVETLNVLLLPTVKDFFCQIPGLFRLRAQLVSISDQQGDVEAGSNE